MYLHSTGQETQNIDFILPSSSTYLTGILRSEADGSILKNGKLALYGKGMVAIAEADVNGIYFISGLRQGNYTLYVRAEQHLKKILEITINDGENTLNLSLQHNEYTKGECCSQECCDNIQKAQDKQCDADWKVCKVACWIVIGKIPDYFCLAVCWGIAQFCYFDNFFDHKRCSTDIIFKDCP